MARREWAQKIIAKYERKDDWGIECISSTEVQRLLQAEHARAVRIVKTRLNGLPSSPQTQWVEGYIVACESILAALTKGRGKGGGR